MAKKIQRVFYIDVSGLHPSSVPDYMESVKKVLDDGFDEKEQKNHVHFFIPVKDKSEGRTGIFPAIWDFFFGRPAATPLTRIETTVLETDD